MEKLLPVVVLLLLVTILALGAAAERTRVTHLKGFDGPLPFSLETGYVEVDETHGVELFYYFIESERKPAEDPVILWVSGGPGCSGLNALFFEIGPLKLDMASYAAAGGKGFPGLLYFEDAWTKASNMIFLDAPVGAGFSYARQTEGLNSTVTGLGRHVRVFLQKWMAQHPELASNPLYIGGDSFSGYTVTVSALEVANHPAASSELNLKGYMVGNARGEVNNDNACRIPYLHGMGLISDELYEAALSSCVVGTDSKNKQQQSAARCSEAQQAISEATTDLNPAHILEPACGADFSPRAPYLSLTTSSSSSSSSYLSLSSVRSRTPTKEMLLECRVYGYELSYMWANDAEVRENLGVREGTIGDGNWALCPEVPKLHLTNDVPTTVPYHRRLTQRGYRALVYNGDHDLLMTHIGTHAWIRSLGYPVVAPWRAWYSNNEVAGFTVEYSNNLTFATVKGAGHMAPESRPKQCLDMVRRWISPAGKL